MSLCVATCPTGWSCVHKGLLGAGIVSFAEGMCVCFHVSGAVCVLCAPAVCACVAPGSKAEQTFMKPVDVCQVSFPLGTVLGAPGGQYPSPVLRELTV